jgi:hypothetical protein
VPIGSLAGKVLLYVPVVVVEIFLRQADPLSATAAATDVFVTFAAPIGGLFSISERSVPFSLQDFFHQEKYSLAQIQERH